MSGEKDLIDRLDRLRSLVDRTLDEFLPNPNTRPATIHEAMRYSLFAGGKRLRPILCLEAAEACRGKIENALCPAAAVECIHTYSLIHDDLPCMDDDELRRGQPTSHIKFGEGVAVLAGDALLTIAFEIIAQTPGAAPFRAADFVVELAKSAGSEKLVGGQVLDLEGEGSEVELSPDDLEFIHLNKTAALISSSLRLGAMSAGVDREQLEALTEYGTQLGLAFQIIDDILDVTQNSTRLGKSVGKDAANAKSTFPAMFGLEQSRAAAAEHTHRALESLQRFGDRACWLVKIASYLLDREY